MLSIKSINRIEAGEIVSQELPAADTNFRKWIAIYPLSHESLRKKYHGFMYKILEFELERVKLNEFFGEDDKLKVKEFFAKTADELERLLSRQGIDSGKFEAPWHNDYPL